MERTHEFHTFDGSRSNVVTVNKDLVIYFEPCARDIRGVCLKTRLRFINGTMLIIEENYFNVREAFQCHRG